MKRKLVFGLLLLLAVAIMALDLHWQVRVQRAVSGLLTPDSQTKVEFTATLPGAQWVPVASDDVVALVRSYNANRQLLAEHATPRLPFGEPPPVVALAPLAKLRVGDSEHQWYLAPRDDRLLQKYLALSRGAAGTPAAH